MISGTISSGAAAGTPYETVVTATDGTFSNNVMFQWAVATPTTVSITALNDQSNLEGDSVSLQVSAADSADGTLIYTTDGLPAGLVIDSSSGLIAGTITAGAANSGPYAVTVTASNGTDYASQSFNWTVSPRISVTAIADQSNDEGDAVSLQVTASSPDGNTLTYSADTLPPGLMISQSTGLISGNISAGASDDGPYAVTVTASDGTYSASQSFNWNVAIGLTINTINDQQNLEGDSVSFQVIASAPDGGTLTYTASGLPAGLSINSTTGALSGTINTGDAVDSPYQTTVTISEGANQVSQSFTWIVSPANQVSIYNPGTLNNVEGATVSYQVSAGDTSVATLTYSANGLPSGLGISSSTGLISGTIDSGAASGGPYSVTVMATDGIGSASQNFLWNVTTTTRTVMGFIVNPPSVSGQGLTNAQVGEFTDSNLSDTASTFTAQINWNDNSSTTGTVVSAGVAGLYHVLGSHSAAVQALVPLVVTVFSTGLAVVLAPDAAPMYNILSIQTLQFNGGTQIPLTPAASYTPSPLTAQFPKFNWQRGPISHPYLYSIGEQLNITASFNAGSTAVPGNYSVRGIVSGPGGNIGIIQQSISITRANQNGINFTAPVIDPRTGNPYTFSQVTIINQLQIQWEIGPPVTASLLGGSVSTVLYQNFGTTAITIYVGFAKPGGPGWAPRLLRETMLNVSCQAAIDAAQGQPANNNALNNPNKLFQAIWSTFAHGVLPGDPITNMQGTAIKYYGTWAIKPAAIQQTVPGANVATDLASGAEMLDNTILDGQCTAWSAFFMLVLEAQGIAAGNKLTIGNAQVVVIYPTNPLEQQRLGAIGGGLLIGGWTLHTTNNPANPTYKYLNIQAANFITRTSTNYSWYSNRRIPLSAPGATYYPGYMAGQGATKPQGLFPNHIVVQIGTLYYDPSYGRKYISLDDFQNQAVAGFYQNATYTDPLTGVAYNANLIRPKTQVLQIASKTIADYVKDIIQQPLP